MYVPYKESFYYNFVNMKFIAHLNRGYKFFRKVKYMEYEKNNGKLSAGFFANLRKTLLSMPKQQKQVCEFILANYQEVAFMTVKVLAERAGVSSATVIRTANKLGYDSFIEFQQQIHQIMISTNTSVWWKIEKSLSVDKSEKGVLERVAEENIRAIRESISQLNIDTFNRSIGLLSSARDIYVLGLRTSSAPAVAFYSLTHQLLPNVKMPASIGSENIYEYLIDMRHEDVLLAISLGGPHYAVRTQDAVEYVHSRGVPVILITDDLTNRSVPYAAEVICITPTSDHYSFIPALTILDGMLVEIGKKKKDQVLERLHSLEQLLIKQKINN